MLTLRLVEWWCKQYCASLWMENVVRGETVVWRECAQKQEIQKFVLFYSIVYYTIRVESLSRLTSSTHTYFQFTWDPSDRSLDRSNVWFYSIWVSEWLSRPTRNPTSAELIFRLLLRRSFTPDIDHFLLLLLEVVVVFVLFWSPAGEPQALELMVSRIRNCTWHRAW